MEVIESRRFFASYLALVLVAVGVPVAAQTTRLTVSVEYEFTFGGSKLCPFGEHAALR